jgi:hypothetical protein
MVDLSVFEAIVNNKEAHDTKKMNDIFSYKNKLFIDIYFKPIFTRALFVKIKG